MNRFKGNWLLLPLSGIYGLITTIRNWLFTNQLLKSFNPKVYSISVGNLTVGGTGKTPMVEFLIKRYGLAKVHNRPGATATLSRGYGRQTTGFRIATEADTAATLGDEPLQLYRKFGSLVRVCVGERRAAAIQQILEHHPETELILLDDAYQHRAVQPHVNLLLMDYNRPFYQDYPFPAGRLRETRHGAQRADAIVVTKCPQSLPSVEQRHVQQKIRPYTRPRTPIFFAGLRYSEPVSFATHQPESRLQSVLLVSGLANAHPLETYVRQRFTLYKHKRLADHYGYTRADVEALMATLPPMTALLTTEKDWVKLDALLTPVERATWPWYYLPVALHFLDEQEGAFTRFLDEQEHKNR